jgi:hypothetical protein
MTQFVPVKTNATSPQRKDYGLGKKNPWGGMATTPFYGIGEQLVENMQEESGYYRKMYGNSLLGTVTVSGKTITEIPYLFEYDKGDGTYQVLAIVKTDTAKWRLRAITANGTVVVPGGGVGDLEFANGTFSYIQAGLFGYIACNAATNNLYSWNGADLVVVSNSIANPLFVFKNGGRIATVNAGIAFFSSRVFGQITNFKVTASGVDMWGNYTVTNSGSMRGAIDANAGAIIFFEKGAELHNVYPNDTGNGIRGETMTPQWNYGGRGPTNQQNITKSKNFVYITNEEGLIQIDPLSGQSKNIIVNTGAIEKKWKTLDFSAMAIQYSQKNEMVCISTRKSGDASNDFLICYHEPYKKFYIKTNVYAKSLALVGGDLYGGEEGSPRIYKLFDTSTFEDGYSISPTARIVKEWDSFGAPEYEKRLQRFSTFMNLNPVSEVEVNLYKDGSTTAIKTVTITASDTGATLDYLSEVGFYVPGIGSTGIDAATNESTQKSFFHQGAFGLLAFEYKETSNFDLRVYNTDIQYSITPTSQGAKIYTSKVYSSDTF